MRDIERWMGREGGGTYGERHGGGRDGEREG